MAKVSRQYGLVDKANVEKQPEWVSDFAKLYALALSDKQVTVVDVARERDKVVLSENILERISNMVSSKPRFATVDDVVQDLRERTGIKEYLKSKK